MADKTLRIIFNGISTLWPGPPRGRDELPKKAFVLMAANVGGRHINEWNVTIPEHFPFVHVAASLLVNPPWPPDEVAITSKGEHFIYFFQDARVRIDRPKAGTPIHYLIDSKKPLAERPGSDDVASPHDIRWLADLRDLLSEPVPLKVDPTATSVGSEVAAIIELDGGELRANFSGDTTNPKTFMDAKGKVVAGLRRVLADEFIINIPYPEQTEQVTLSFQKLRKGSPVVGPKQLVLRWPQNETTLELRMDNDPKEEVSNLDTPERFDPVRLVGPALIPREDDFDLHYNLVDIPPDVQRPLPQNDIQQCDFPHCKPGTT
jgi:hypothetical protein